MQASRYTFVSTVLIFLLLPSAFFAQTITGVWQTAASQGFSSRYSITSSVVNGRIYVFGGIKGNDILNTLEVYDPGTNKWSTPTTTGTFTPRYGLTSSVVNNKIYVIGGYDDSCLATVEMFDPSSNTWSTPVTTGTFTPRAHLTSNVVNGKIYVIGGVQYDSNQNTIYLNSIEVFDPQTNIWSTPVTTGKLGARATHSSAVVGGKIYVMGGDGPGGHHVDVFDPVMNTCDSIATMLHWRSDATANVLSNKIFFMGGYNGNDVNLVDCFDPGTNSWSTPQTTGTFTAREGLASSVVGNSLYAMGGLSDALGFLNTNEVLNLNTATAAETSRSDIAIFPNPSSGIIAVTGLPENIIKIDVINMLGQTVLELSNTYSSTATLDLSNKPAGLYFAKFITTNSTQVKKIIRR